jgi:hypothetical protein
MAGIIRNRTVRTHIRVCFTEESAQSEARAMFGDMARGIADGLRSNPEWQMKVADQTGMPIFRLSVIAESLK